MPYQNKSHPSKSVKNHHPFTEKQLDMLLEKNGYRRQLVSKFVVLEVKLYLVSACKIASRDRWAAGDVANVIHDESTAFIHRKSSEKCPVSSAFNVTNTVKNVKRQQHAVNDHC
ncbi:hypothetical protein JTE90_019863 [Oedothorax gibbosus]|uniref:Uncharacterized protein n=1 Tax=Oedothorax gibbosus TaxID=931172 RepID=A0AAV6VWQ4_9ARAC|nr:hypothetical protein JTE90_019863 [Oedothorax gibbosus]